MSMMRSTCAGLVANGQLTAAVPLPLSRPSDGAALKREIAAKADAGPHHAARPASICGCFAIR